MAIVLILDQRGSRTSRDLITSTASYLNRDLGSALRLPFVRTAGDEMQAVLASEHGLYPAAVVAMRGQTWWLGVGIGGIDEPVGPTARESKGSAFWLARAAVDAAKNKRKSPRGVAVAGDGTCTKLAQDLDAALNALAFISEGRTPRQWEAVEWARRGLSGADVAEQLEVSPQGASQLLRAAGFEEERRLKRLLGHLARRAVPASACDD
jgi:hypothetical protein